MLFRSFTVEEAEARLEAAGVAYSRMNDVGEVFDHPQVRARKRLLEVSVPGGAVQLLRMPFNIQCVEEDGGAVPAVGQHTDAILAELGYGELEIESMHAAGAV